MVSRRELAQQLKIKKYRMKRSGKSRRFAKVALNTGPAPLIIAEYKARTGNEIIRDKRGHIIVTRDQEWERYLAAVFRGKTMTEQQLLARQQPNDEGWRTVPLYPRAVVLQKLKEIREKKYEPELFMKLEEMLSDVDNLARHFAIINTPWHRVDCFFSPTKDVCFLFEIAQHIGLARRSRSFTSIVRAQQAWKLGQVKWVSSIPLSLPP